MHRWVSWSPNSGHFEVGDYLFTPRDGSVSEIVCEDCVVTNADDAHTDDAANTRARSSRTPPTQSQSAAVARGHGVAERFAAWLTDHDVDVVERGAVESLKDDEAEWRLP